MSIENEGNDFQQQLLNTQNIIQKFNDSIALRDQIQKQIHFIGDGNRNEEGSEILKDAIREYD